MPGKPKRSDRRHGAKTHHDQRNPFQRDRDRILYSSAFRRLAGVTQVVGVAEGHLFHNRLTHSIKVAQIARRIAEQVAKQADESGVAKEFDCTPDVAEAAALAHDLGHPPFGHAGEDALNAAVAEVVEDGDGYEGNAQSFRIITKLALRHEYADGLDLTRATLRAVLKYPWLREAEGKRAQKYGAYASEQDDFDFARAGCEDDSQSTEACLMDWSDDIAYAIHDVDDFYRSGLIPLRDLADEGAQGRFLHDTEKYWSTENFGIAEAKPMVRKIADAVPASLLEPYTGAREQTTDLQVFTSWLVDRYVQAVELSKDANGEPAIAMADQYLRELRILKQLMRHYVFSTPALLAQQRGQWKVVHELFTDLFELSAKPRWLGILPPVFREAVRHDDSAPHRARVSADVIASMTEPQAYALYGRLRGSAPGTIRDGIF